MRWCVRDFPPPLQTTNSTYRATVECRLDRPVHGGVRYEIPVGSNLSNDSIFYCVYVWFSYGIVSLVTPLCVALKVSNM